MAIRIVTHFREKIAKIVSEMMGIKTKQLIIFNLNSNRILNLSHLRQLMKLTECHFIVINVIIWTQNRTEHTQMILF